METTYPLVPLGEISKPISRKVIPVGGESYRQIGVKWWGEGVYERDAVDGFQTQYKALFQIKTDDIIINKIWARHGSVAVVQPELDGCFGGNEFPTFVAVLDKLLPRWMHWIAKSKWFWSACDLQSKGTSGKNRIRPEKFLEIPIPLPTLAEQRRIVKRIDALAAKIEEARGLREKAAAEAEVLLTAGSSKLFHSKTNCRKFGDIVNVVDPNPSHRYPAYIPKGIPIISSSEFSGVDDIDWSLAKCVPEEFYQNTLGKYDAGEGDVIFSRKGKVGYARLHPRDIKLAMTHTLCLFQPNSEVLLPKYLLHFARSSVFIEALLGTMNPNTGVPTLGLGVIRKTEIPVPPLAEQKRIVARLDALQSKVVELKQHQTHTQAELDALLPSVLDRAFRGEM